MSTATNGKRVAKGFDVTCPFCGDQDSGVTLELRNLSEVTCPACDETYSPRAAFEKAQAQADQWRRVMEWVESAPLGA